MTYNFYGMYVFIEDDFAGVYYSWSDTSDEKHKALLDKYQENYPPFMPYDPNLKVLSEVYKVEVGREGRGVFCNNNETFLVWVNVNDQLRIISINQDNDIKEAFNTLKKYVLLPQPMLSRNLFIYIYIYKTFLSWRNYNSISLSFSEASKLLNKQLVQ